MCFYARGALFIYISLFLLKADAQITATSSPGINTSHTWLNMRADCQGADLANSPGFPNAAQCQQLAINYGPACGGALWDSSTGICWLKSAAGGYVFTANKPTLTCMLILERLSATVLATIPTPTPSSSFSATQGFSMTSTPSPLPATPVWALPADSSTGLPGYIINSATPGGPVFVPDRNGCQGGALSLMGGAYLTLNGVTGLPSGNSARSISAWVQCSGSANDVVEWGGGGGAANARSGLYMFTTTRGTGFVGQSNDYFTPWSSCTNSWNHVAVTYNTTRMTVYINGVINGSQAYTTPLNTPSTTTVWVGWNGVTSYSAGQLFGSGTPAHADVDDLQIFNVSLPPAAVAALAVFSRPCASVTPTPSMSSTASATTTSSRTATASVTAASTASPTSTATMTGSWTPTLSRGATASQSGAPTASPQPSPGVPVDSANNYVCKPAGAAKGTLRWGAYTVIGGADPNTWTPFDTCDTNNTVVGAQGLGSYYFKSVNGATYCHLAQFSGHPGSAGACSFPATGYCAPTVRFTADQQYATLTATAFWCPSAGCGWFNLASMRYIVNGSVAVLWTANSTGTLPYGAAGPYVGYVQGFGSALQNCTTGSLSGYFNYTAVLTNVPPGAAIELRNAPGSNPPGCNCDAFNYRLQVSGTLASPTSTASQTTTATASITSGASASVTATGTAASTPSGSFTTSSSPSATVASPSSTQSRIPVTNAATSSDSTTGTPTVTPPATPSSSITASSAATSTATFTPLPSVLIIVANASTSASPSTGYTPAPLGAAVASSDGSLVPAIIGGAAGAVAIGVAAAIILAVRRRRDRRKLTLAKTEVLELRQSQKEAAASQRSLAQALSEISALRETLAAASNPMHAASAGASFRAPHTSAAEPVTSASSAGVVEAQPALARAMSGPSLVRSTPLARTPSFVKRAEAPLAPGWSEVGSGSGGASSTPYWKNASTGMTTWSRPTMGEGSSGGGAGSGATDAEAEAKAGLLPDWDAIFSKSRQVWYWRHKNGETTWDKPKAAAASAAASASPATSAPLPAGWEEKWSASKGMPYWFKVDDPSVTTWEKPTQPA